MAKNSYRGWKVRGFWAGDPNRIVLVKGRNIRTIKVISTISTNNKWTFTTLDGFENTLPQAKKSVNVLNHADLVTNFFVVYGNPFYEICEDYSNLDPRSVEYRLVYLKRRFFKKKPHISSPVEKLWKKDGKYHVVTQSGSHYVFSR